MRRLSALLGPLPFILLAAPALAAGNPEQGRRIAERWCSSCHLVSPAQRQALADVPSFATIARRPDLTESLLGAFLATPHPPMPNLSLSRSQVTDLLAYIRSLQ